MIKFFKRLSLRLLLFFRSLVKYERNTAEDLSILTQMLQTDLFENIIQSDTASLLIQSNKSSIGELTLFLKELNQNIVNDRSVNKNIFELNTHSVNVAHFFSTKEGFYLEEVKAITELKHQLESYSIFLVNHCKDEVGMKAHNVRILKSVSEQLVATILTLVYLSTK